MSERSWFFASQGQQQGPYPDVQMRAFVGKGVVTAETLVWTEGMAGWQKAAEIPGMIPRGGLPPDAPGFENLPVGAGAAGLAADLPLWPLFGRSLLYVVGILLVIPAPWVATSFYRWMASRMNVPGRPNLAFNGQVGDIWYVFVALGLMSYAGQAGHYLQFISILVNAFLSWMILRWIVENLSSNGQPLLIAFSGSVWTFVGWQVLMFLAVFTIIGWAWVIAAWMRWTCRNISGTRREIIFNATGLDVLWRSVLFSIACAFLIPIPWVLRWYTQWYVSQFALVERTA